MSNLCYVNKIYKSALFVFEQNEKLSTQISIDFGFMMKKIETILKMNK